MLDDVLLDIEPVDLSTAGVEALERLSAQPEARWYYLRRRAALRASGLLGAFNPMQPRGRDGRWIEVLGWVRWLENGHWKWGQVSDWDKNNGSVRVNDRFGKEHKFSKWEAAQKLYTQVKPKAKLSLPDPKASKDAPGFQKIGGQGGSNPGGLYEVSSKYQVGSHAPITADMVKQATTFTPGAAAILPKKAEISDTDISGMVRANIGADLAGDGILFDNTDNKAYLLTNGSWTDFEGNTVSPDEMFGSPGGPKRGHDFTIMPVGEQEVLSDLIIRSRTLQANKPQFADKFYVKTSKSETHARNEALANFLYELGGVPVPDVSVGDDGITVASGIVKGDTSIELSQALKDQSVIEQLQENFVFDAWLANWDVVGLDFDNVKVVDGVPYRIDAGGALLYRAQGSPKGKLFGNEVGELETLRFMNQQSGTVFKNISNEMAVKGAERLAAISPQDITNGVKEHGLDQSLADTLIARRKYILDHYGVDEPAIDLATLVPPVPTAEAADLEPPVVDVNMPDGSTVGLPDITPPETTSEVAQALEVPDDISNMHWDVASNSFMPGAADEAAGDAMLANQNDQFIPALNYHIISAYQHGESVQMTTALGMVWDIIDYDPTGAPGGKFRIRHVGNGEERDFPIEDSKGITMVRTDPTQDQRDLTADLTVAMGNHVVNNFQGLDDQVLYDGSSFATLASRQYQAGEVLKPGQWIITKGTDGLTPMRVLSQDDSDTYTVETLDGKEGKYLPWNVTDRVGLEGSWFDQFYDAKYARNQVAAKQEKNDPTGGPGLNPDPTPGDLTMQALDASEPAVAVGTPAETVDTPEVVEPAAASFDPDDAVNPDIKVHGDAQVMDDVDYDTAQSLVGQQLYFTKQGGAQPVEFGFYTVESVENWGGGVRWHLVRPNGQKGTLTSGTASTNNVEFFQIEGNIAPIMQYTTKKNGDIVVNGEVVGSWKVVDEYTPGYGYKHYEAVLHAKYTVMGKDIPIKSSDKAGIKTRMVDIIAAPGSGGAVPKSEKVKKLEKQLVFADVKFGATGKETTEAGAAVTLLDGAKIEMGMWVISKTDGKVGKITALEVSPEAGVEGSVKVTFPDGTTKIRGASTLSASVTPAGEVPPASPLYSSVKLSDGSQPFPSQEVTEGATSVIIMALKQDGTARILRPDGSKSWVKANTLTPSKDYAQNVEIEVDVQPSAAVAMVDESWKIAPKPGKTPYAAPGGAIISQASDAVAKYRQYDPTRKLTKDNFVPTVGMRVRNKAGDQLVILRQANTYDKNPSTVWVTTLDGSPYDKPKAVQPNSLWVDHAAELATPDGKPIPKISSLHFTYLDNTLDVPNGTTVYSVAKGVTYQGERKVQISYVAVQPDGIVYKIDSHGSKTGITGAGLKEMLGSSKLRKVAYIDHESGSMMTVEHVGGSTNLDSPVVWVHDKAPGSLEQLKTDNANAKLAEISVGDVEFDLDKPVEPSKFEGDTGMITSYTVPKPSTASASTGPAITTPPPPPIQVDADRLRGAAKVAGAHTIESGLAKLKETAAAGGPNGNVLYSMGDSDYIEDMAIRLQNVVDGSGKEYVEVRFRLLEDKADDLAKRLITNNGQVKKGAWSKTAALKGPKQMADGDVVAVRVSSAGTLKPADINVPNATVVGTPQLVGKTPGGFDAYRVNVMMAGGFVGHIIVEDRATPSIQVYEWDDNKVVSSSAFNGSLSTDAASIGWSVRNEGSIGYEALSDHTQIIDEKGRKKLDTSHNKLQMKVTGTHQGAMRMRYDAGDGSFLTVQSVHPDSDHREAQIADHANSAGLRHSSNGEVLIRVPVDDPNALDRISQMMSAVGVPPAAQGQPSGTELRKMALNKVFKQFNDTYTHMQRPDITGDDDASAQAVLSLINKRFPALKRPARMDDIHTRVTDDGRMMIVLSDEVAEAATKKSNYSHSFHVLKPEHLNELLWTNKSTTGVLSTDERWSAGIVTSGMSSSADPSHDAGNRVYLRFSTDTTLKLSHNYEKHGKVVVSPLAANKLLDTYWNPSDRWGRRKKTNADFYTQTSFSVSDGGGNELMIKRRLEHGLISYFIVGTETKRNQLIKSIKASGLTHVNGRAIEDIIRVSGTVTTDEINNFGVHYGTEAPITDIPLADEPTAVPAPTVIAGGQ